jgi:hypothetical protein
MLILNMYVHILHDALLKKMTTFNRIFEHKHRLVNGGRCGGPLTCGSHNVRAFQVAAVCSVSVVFIE